MILELGKIFSIYRVPVYQSRQSWEFHATGKQASYKKPLIPISCPIPISIRYADRPPLAGHMMQFTSLAFLKAQEKLCGPIPVFYFGLKFKYLDLRLLSAKWWRIIAISRFLIQFAFSSYTWFFVLAFSIISTLILSIPSLPEIWGASAAIPNAPVIFYALTIFLIIPICILRFVLAEYLAKHHRKLEDTSQFRHPICQSVLVSDEP